MNTNILSFNTWKLDTIWPTNRCMQTLQAQSVKAIQNRSQWYKNQNAMCFHVSRYFELKSILRVEKIFSHLLSIISQKKKKKKIQFSIVYTSRKITYTKLYRTQKLINQFLDQVEYPILQIVCMLCVKTMRDMTAKMQDG